jgi:hypothetical protein
MAVQPYVEISVSALHYLLIRAQATTETSISRVGGIRIVKIEGMVANKEKNCTSFATTFIQSVATVGEGLSSCIIE